MPAPRNTPASGPPPRRAWVAAMFGLVLVACGAAYWPGLGDTGFSMSEGHRVLPAWEMMDRGEYLVPRLFGQAYLRKPPGMPWAIALASAVLGRTEFAARAVSAASMTVMAVVAFVFAARWYGARWGVVGGLATALSPLGWGFGRSAEIEALNAAATHLAVLLILDMLALRPGGPPAGRVTRAALLGVAITAVGLAKGPASAPCLGAAIVAACLARSAVRPALAPALWGPAAAAVAALAIVAWRIAGASAGELVVTQAPSEFLWNAQRLTLRGFGGVAKLTPESLFLALPASAALLFPWGRDAREEAGRSDAVRDACRAARAVGVTSLLALVFYAALGVDNPRYVAPATLLAPMAVPYVLRGAGGEFGRVRRIIARAMMMGSPWIMLAILVVGAQVFRSFSDDERNRLSGRDAGIALGGALPDGAEVWADGLIEARPEVLHYARQQAARRGRTVRIRWTPRGPDGVPAPPPGGFVILRFDAGLDEVAEFAAAHAEVRTERVAAGRVSRYEFALLRIAPGPP